MFSLAPWVPVSRKELPRVERLASLKPGDTFVEIGCGDGRVLRYIAKRHPGVQLVGIEISIIFYLLAKLNVFLLFRKYVSVRYGDALKYDLGQADVVYTYSLRDTLNKKLMPKIKSELQSGARLISYMFKIDQESDVRVDSQGLRPKIYIYTQP